MYSHKTCRYKLTSTNRFLFWEYTAFKIPVTIFSRGPETIWSSAEEMLVFRYR
jgi:hypothetical protein